MVSIQALLDEMRNRRHHRHSPLAVVIEQREVAPHVGVVEVGKRREVVGLDVSDVAVPSRSLRSC